MSSSPQQPFLHAVVSHRQPRLSFFVHPAKCLHSAPDARPMRPPGSHFAAASAITSKHGGQVPGDLDALRALPGVGQYTAAAVGSIAFGLQAAVVDGNVERVLARLRLVDEPVRKAAGKRRIQALADAFLNQQAPGDHNQAMMELGARVCKPRQPTCDACPLRTACAGRLRWAELPVLPVKASRLPKRHEGRVLLIDPQGQIAWRRRPNNGLYASLPDLPEFDVKEEPPAYGEITANAHTKQLLSHRELHLKGVLMPVAVLPDNFETGSLSAFLAKGPPTPVARLVRLLHDSVE